MAGIQTLGSLLLGTIMFLSMFVLFIALIPQDIYIPFKDYEEYYTTHETLGGTDLNIWNQTKDLNMSGASGSQKIEFGDINILFYWTFNYPNLWGFYAVHVEWYIPFTEIAILWHILLDGDNGRIYYSNVMENYVNDTDSSHIKLSCDHITLDLTIYPTNQSLTLPEAMQENEDIRLNMGYEIDFTRMGTNIWIILGSVFTFQAIKTGVVYADIFLNALITIPLYVSTGYILYRLITGLIPTLSGGGGA